MPVQCMKSILNNIMRLKKDPKASDSAGQCLAAPRLLEINYWTTVPSNRHRIGLVSTKPQGFSTVILFYLSYLILLPPIQFKYAFTI